MSLLSFINKEKEEVALLIDVGNGTVTTGLVLFRVGSLPKFLYTITLPFVIPEKPTAVRLFDQVSSLVDSGLKTLMKDGFSDNYPIHKKKISRSLVALSSPWFFLKTKHIQISKEEPFLISNSFLDDILEKEEEVFKKELMKEDNEKNFFEVVEKSIVHTKINGYVLENSIGNKTKVLDAFACLSVVSTEVTKKINDLVLKHAHLSKDRVVIHTFPLISFSVIRNIFPASSDFIIVDVTSEVIDVTLVIDDVVVRSNSIPSGKNFIIRKILKEFGVSPEIAESILSMYSNKKSDELTSAKIFGILSNVEKEWAIYMDDVIGDISKGYTVPGKVFITADEDFAKLALNFIHLPEPDPKSKLSHIEGDNIIYLKKEMLSPFYETNIKNKVNQFIAFLAIFYEKVIKK